MRSHVLAACLATACLGAIPSEPPAPLPPGGHHVLFVGNSLTYTNDLPATLQRVAAAGGDTVVARMVAGPDLAVIDHATGATPAPAAIRGERWEWVVLQQGPTPAGLDRDTLLLATRLLDPLVPAAGGRTLSLMTWPSAAQRARYPRLFDETRETCDLAAAAVPGGRCAPAGDAWRAAWAADPSLALYGPDGHHPSPLGTLLTALVLYEAITGRDARALPATDETTRLLRRAAHEAVAGR